MKKNYLMVIIAVCIVSVAVVAGAGYVLWLQSPLLPVKDELVVAQGPAWKTWDPSLETADICVGEKQLVFEPLLTTAIADTGGLKRIPLLATSWTRINDTAFELNLRKGVKFQCGRDFTAWDVKFTLEKWNNPEHLSSFGYEVGQYFEVVDNYTIRIGTSDPFGMTPLNLDRHAGAIQCRACYDGDTWDTAVDACGTGPYKFVELKAGEYVKLERFDGYWNGTPSNRIKDITIKFIADSTARVTALEAGQVDIISDVPATAMALLASKGLTVETWPSTRTQQIFMNTKKAPFSDIRVRQAINHAIDRAELARTLFMGLATTADCPVSPYTDGYNPLWPVEYNLTKAKALLAEAGYANGFDTTIRTCVGRYLMDKECVEAVAAYLGQVGIRVKVETYDWASYTDMIRGESNKLIPDIDLYYFAWGAISTYQQVTSALFAAPLAYNGSSWSNAMGYYREEIQQLIPQIETASEAEYYSLNRQIVEYWVQDVPAVPLVYQKNLIAHVAELKGIKWNPFGAPQFSTGYFEPEELASASLLLQSILVAITASANTILTRPPK